MRSSFLTLGLSVAIAGLWAAEAHATLNIQVGDSVTINGTIDTSQATTGYISWKNGSSYTTENVWAGAFSVTATDNGPEGSGSAVIHTFCTDVGANWIANQNVAYVAKDFASSFGVNPQWSVSPEAIQNAAWLYNQEFVGKTLSAAQAAGVQLAIWKVLYDTIAGGTLGANSAFNAGNMKVTTDFSGGVADASLDITALLYARAHTFTTYTTTWLDPTAKVNPSQGLIWTPETPGNDVTPVPEPATLVAGCLLLLPLAASSARILRRKRAA